MTVSPHLPKPAENLIDEELVEFLNIPLKKIEARRFSFAGIESRIVGHISQTVQCVVKGQVCGTTHLKAAVVRHLSKLYNLDCIAGGKTFKQLLSSDILTNKSTVYTCDSDGAAEEILDEEESVRSTSPSSTPSSRLSAATTPTPRPPGIMTPSVNYPDISPTSPTSPSSTRPSTAAMPAPTPRSRPTGATPTSPSPARTPTSPHGTDLGDSWNYQGGKQSRFDARSRRPVDKHWKYNAVEDIWTLPYTKAGPMEKPATPDHTVAYIQLRDEDALTSFCNVIADGWPKVASPKTEPTPTTISTSIQAISSSKYPCGDCGELFSVCQSRCQRARRYQDYIHGNHAPPYVTGHTGTELPPDFNPCSNYCMYDQCECLRRYNGRDWAS